MFTAIAFLLPLLAPFAEAHPLDLGFIQMAAHGPKLQVSLDLNPSVGAILLKHPPTELTQPLVEGRFRDLFDATLGTGPLVAGPTPCTWSEIRSELLAQTVRISALATCTETTSLHWSFPFVHRQDLPANFQILVKADFGGTEHVYTADGTRDAINIKVDAEESSIGRFVYMGIAHIGAFPSEWWGPRGFRLPLGVDHILFLLGLILGGGTLLQMVKTATGFTVGHSLTLALASLGLVRFPPRFVESAVALSIAIVALETICLKAPRDRWKIAAAFGLVHGFSFATALGNLNLSGTGTVKALLGFNLGVEMGQILIVAGMAPLVTLLRSRPLLRRIAVPAASGGIFFAGAYWFVQRAFGY